MQEAMKNTGVTPKKILDLAQVFPRLKGGEKDEKTYYRIL